MKFIPIFLIFSLIASICLTGCKNETNEQAVTLNPSDNNMIETEDRPSYEDFTKFLDNFTNDIVINGFKLVPPIKTIFLIERDFTFNKKDTITLEGGVSDFNPTQQLFIFENPDKSVQLYVRFSYTDVNMGNNLVAWESPSGYSGIDQELSKRTDMATYTYRNLIVTVTQNAKAEANTSLTKEAVKSVLNMLEKHYSN